nr:cytochrome c biogenesis protein CcsA [Bacteroidota bacterium]
GIMLSSMGSQGNDSADLYNKVFLQPMQVYQIGESKIVLRQFEMSATMRAVPSNQSGSDGLADALVVQISSDDDEKEVIIWGKKGIIGDFKEIDFDGEKISLSYGSAPIFLPFKIYLNKFILERYPGSNSPSSYASEVTLIDETRNKEFGFRIFMNHILDYRGYRFYQTYFDTDELGTVLSVNHDAAGTFVSYFGYALMSLGMILALVTRRSRFRHVLKSIGEIRKKRTSALAILVFATLLWPSFVMSRPELVSVDGIRVNVVDKAHAEKFGRLMVLSTNGRLEPMNTLTDKLLRKFTGKNRFHGLNADQVFLGIIAEPGIWQKVPLLKIKNSELCNRLNISGNYASFSDFFDFDHQNSYMLGKLVEDAYKKSSAGQSKFDKAVIKADEKINIFYLLYSGSFLKVFPKIDETGSKWYHPNETITGLPGDDSLFIRNAFALYYERLQEAFQTGNYTEADEIIDAVSKFQKNFAGGIIMSETKQNIEILYNKADIFERLFKFYGLFGLFFLVVLFVNLVAPKLKIGILKNVIIVILLISFILQTLGLAARWYISGHAPMSNGFESMIFISWATMLAGFLLVRKSNIALAATTVLASLTLFVAHLNWMNPEVTNLVPVLKSIWLTIHVAIITSSYGFLGLGAVLGLFNLLLMIFQNQKNKKRFDLTIREISFTSEATLTIGLYLITIGTFLGAVWANESWGRYWGWDPKETWALVTVLVYAVVIHLHFIPGAMGRYLFNALSVLGFSSVLMTYFGVNYYLSGLHSYAGGDPVPIPTFVYYSIAALMV